MLCIHKNYLHSVCKAKLHIYIILYNTVTKCLDITQSEISNSNGQQISKGYTVK